MPVKKKPETTQPSASDHAVTTPVFIPLKTEYYEAFCDGSKTTEYRKYGKRWNEKNCDVGRRVTISKGYGKKHRRHGVIIGFKKRRMSSKAWIDCYGEPGMAACIEIKLDRIYGKCDSSCCHCWSL